MGFFENCKSVLLYFAYLFPSELTEEYAHGKPILLGQLKGPLDVNHHLHKPPSFEAPNGPDLGLGFLCEYPSMPGWKACSTPQDRGCWLEGPSGGSFNISTDYESTWPKGVTRKYHLNVANMTINGDGIEMPYGKVFNQQYPGPWIQACWGDTIEVNVTNYLPSNGTTVHWHGLRQLGTPEMDGVNAVSQCPIAYNDWFVYSFNATQYGTSWYHSHYSLQYADGLLGPITIYGPSSSEYDEGRDPILISDWGHRSAFMDWPKQLTGVPSYPKMNSVLLNGLGNFAGQFPHEIFNMTVQRGKKYLLRIINTSLDTEYIFSIDNHNLTVVAADFVPIVPYNASNIAVAIGQRYNVILDANPNDDNGEVPPDGNFWIRTISTVGCSGFEKGNEPGERQGILRYNSSSTNIPITTRPPYNTTCREEPFDSLIPILQWDVPPVTLNATQRLDIGKPNFPNLPAQGDNFFWWAFGDSPMWLDFANPTILNLQNTTWNPEYVVIQEDAPADSWVYLIATAPEKPPHDTPDGRTYWPVAHPMHLHGHDFVLLAQGSNSSLLPNVPLKFDNPPRRDTALIVSGGYIVIAFKADNPGSWLMHCHIPWHASNGLAIQILERQEDFKKLMTVERLAETNRVCANWTKWYNNPANHYDPNAPFQDDSGI